MKASRYKTRRFAVQCLYSRIFLSQQEFVLLALYELFFSEEKESFLDEPYIDEILGGVQEKEEILQHIIRTYAPKFDVDKMPLLHVMIIYLSLYELLFLQCDTIPDRVVINEAVELAKYFSDDMGRQLINGVLHNIKEHREDIQKRISTPSTLSGVDGFVSLFY